MSNKIGFFAFLQKVNNSIATKLRVTLMRSHNTYNTSSRKECEKDGSDKPLHDERDDAIASHQSSMFLVQSHLGQEEGKTTMMDNILISYP